MSPHPAGPGAGEGAAGLLPMRAMVARLDAPAHVLVLLGELPLDEALLACLREAAEAEGLGFSSLVGAGPLPPRSGLAGVDAVARAAEVHRAAGRGGFLVVGEPAPGTEEPCAAVDLALGARPELAGARVVCCWTRHADSLATDDAFVRMAMAHRELFLPRGTGGAGQRLVTRIGSSEPSDAQAAAGPRPREGGGVSPGRRG